MDTTHIRLLDTGTSFILVADDIEAEIEYGRFALSLANSDYEDIHNLIENFILNNKVLHLAEDLQKSATSNDIIHSDIANLILRPLYKEISQFLAKDYLNEYQSAIITLFLIADIRKNISDEQLDLSCPTTYIPFIYADKEIHAYVRDTLLKKQTAFDSSLQSIINHELEFTSSLLTTHNGIPYQCYFIKNLLDYLLIDLHKYLSLSKKVNECECCGKLFFPLFRSSEKFCYFNNSACKDKMKRKPNDEFAYKRNSYRGYQSGRIKNQSTQKQYPLEFLNTLYDTWSAECGKKCIEYKKTNDLNGYEQWFQNTKFTAERLQEEYQKFMQSQNLS